MSALHVWPEFRKHFATPSATAFSRSASSRITFGDLPPSSSATFLTVAAATSDTRRPARVEPVKEIMSTVGVGSERLPDHRAVAGDEVERAGGKPDLVDDLRQHEGVERSHLRGLDHHRAAGGQRRRHLGGDLVQGVVPRRDRADHADRLAHDQRVADLLFPGRLRHDLRHGGEVSARQPRLDHRRELDRHPHLLGDQRGDLVHALPDRVRDRSEGLGAPLDRRLRTSSKGLLGRR